VRFVSLLAVIGCQGPPLGAVIDADWLVAASPVEASMEIACAGATAGSGRIDILVDDEGGWTYLHESGTDRIWLRDPTGLIPDRCWWLPGAATDGTPLPNAHCISNGLQDGQCTGDENVDSAWSFHTPGVVRTTQTPRRVDIVDGVLVALTGNGIERLDLTSSDHQPVDDSEGYRTYHRWLDQGAARAGDTDFVVASGAAVVWDADDGKVRTVDRGSARRQLSTGEERSAPRGSGVMAAAGDWAAIITTKRAQVLELGEKTKARRRDHAMLKDGVLDAALDPETGDLYVLTAEGTLLLPTTGRSHLYDTIGAEGLILGRPAGKATVYAWGNDPNGVVYRLRPDGGAEVHHFDRTLQGAGVGKTFQEIVLAFEGAPTRVSGWLDQEHIDAIAPGTISAGWAAFVETPRDEDADEQRSQQLVDTLGLTCDAQQSAACCVQSHRNQRVADNLRALTDEPVILGVNPVAIDTAANCSQADLATAIREADLPLAILLHSPAAEATSETELRSFYSDLVARAALGEPEPEWTLLGGGYEGAGVPGIPAWPSVFPDLELPDGSLPDALYFGGAGMNPDVAAVAHKELAPLDARRRPFPVGVRTEVNDWDGVPDTDVTYLPGQTVALNWLYESHRSGLLFADFVVYADKDADWTTSAFRGEESPHTMDLADVTLNAHYLSARVIGHRETTPQRWWYMHLQDLADISSPALDDGWMQCDDSCVISDLPTLLQGVESVITWAASPQVVDAPGSTRYKAPDQELVPE
jgi:hypothetical protein